MAIEVRKVVLGSVSDPSGLATLIDDVAFDGSDVRHHRHIKGAIGGPVGAAVDDPGYPR